MISAEQFAEWKEHPITKEIFAEIKNEIKEITQKIAAGHTVGHAADVTHGLTSKAVGQVEGLNQLLNISYADEKLEEDVNEITAY